MEWIYIIMEWIRYCVPGNQASLTLDLSSPGQDPLLSGNEDSCCWLRGVMLQAGTKEASLRPAAGLHLGTLNHLGTLMYCPGWQ